MPAGWHKEPILHARTPSVRPSDRGDQSGGDEHAGNIGGAILESFAVQGQSGDDLSQV